jgi:hypothetical protein
MEISVVLLDPVHYPLAEPETDLAVHFCGRMQQTLFIRKNFPVFQECRGMVVKISGLLIRVCDGFLRNSFIIYRIQIRENGFISFHHRSHFTF